MTPVDELTEDQLVHLIPIMMDGKFEYDRAANRLRNFEFTFDPRFQTVLLGRLRTYMQDVVICSVGSGSEEDGMFFTVQQYQETYVRKWYKTPNGGGTTTLHSTLTWIVTTSSVNQSIRLWFDEDGNVIDQPECEVDVEGDKPENWDEGYTQTGYFFTHMDDPVIKEDQITTTDATMASTATGNEILRSDSGYGIYKRFGRRWATANDFTFSVEGGYTLATGCKRTVLDLIATGLNRIPFTLYWTETLHAPGETSVITEHEQNFSAGDGWTFTLDDGFPDYKWSRGYSEIRIRPV
jgi:hypothetical protein